MSGEPTEREVKALARVLRDVAPKTVTWSENARAVLTSDWYAERIAQARREAAAEVVERAASRVALATHPHSPTFDAYMDAARIVRAALRGES